MASTSLHLRRVLRTFPGLHRSLSGTSSTSAPPLFHLTRHGVSSTLPSPQSPTLPSHSRAFRSSSISLLSSRSPSFNTSDEIGPDTILFEGCDYNHWLIVMDFPKDNKPSPQQMVETYEQTCAKGLNISLEEAKKKMYACSTTTYTGFQAVMTEEESEKFNGLPGVIFVLPDSYIDPVNKEYGGDKYINGTIIPRPPPIQYARNQRRDRSRNPDQPRYNQQDQPRYNQHDQPRYNQHDQPRYNQQDQMSGPPRNRPSNFEGPMQGDGRNYRPQQFQSPQQNYGAPSQSYPQGQNYGPPSQQYAPQQPYGPASQQIPQQPYGPASSQQAPQPNFRQSSPPGQGNMTGYNRNYDPSQGGNYGQGHGYQGNTNTYGQGTNQGYGQNIPGQGEGQRFASGEQRNEPFGQTGTEKGRY